MNVRHNINDTVRVKLKDDGLRIYREDKERLREMVPLAARDSIRLEPVLDADGYWRTQMWGLMQLFGPHLGLGLEVPFDTEIIIERATEVCVQHQPTG